VAGEQAVVAHDLDGFGSPAHPGPCEGDRRHGREDLHRLGPEQVDQRRTNAGDERIPGRERDDPSAREFFHE
jgi:hypothetical protein